MDWQSLFSPVTQINMIETKKGPNYMHKLKDLFFEQLMDIYDAEKQLVNTLPKMSDAACSPDLRDAFTHHFDQTRSHMDRLEMIFERHNLSPNGEKCEAMQGLIEEAEDIIAQEGDESVKDAALIAIAQRVEHYEIAAYGSVHAFADELNMDTARSLLGETLREEKKTDRKLTDLALDRINPQPQGLEADETVVALYDEFLSARAAIEELTNAGLSKNEISLVSNDQDDRFAEIVRGMDDDDSDADADDGAGFGAIVGALAGLSVALIPGLGQFVVAGAAGAALYSGLGAATGALTGGLTAGLIDMGVEGDRAKAYGKRVREGGTLVLVHVDDAWEDKAERILKKHNPVDVDETNS